MNKSIGVCMQKKESTEIEISKKSVHQEHSERVGTHFCSKVGRRKKSS